MHWQARFPNSDNTHSARSPWYHKALYGARRIVLMDTTLSTKTIRNPMLSRFSQLTLAMVLSFFVILAPLPVLAAGDYGLSATAGAAGLKTNKSLPQLVGQIVGAGLSLLGIIFLGLMLYGGFRWMTARGDTKMVSEAKDTITNAVIGIAIVVSAYAITDFVIKAVVGGAGGGGGGGGGAEQAGANEESAGDAQAVYEACLVACDNSGLSNDQINDCYNDQCGPLVPQ